MTEQTSDVVKKFLAEQFLADFDDGSVTDDTDLFATGILDSFGLIQLVQHVQTVFKIKLRSQDLASPLMTSIAGIVALVDERRRAT